MTAEQRAEQIYRGNTIEEEAYKNGWYDAINKACDWIMRTPMYAKQPSQLVEEFKQAMEADDE